MTGLVDVHTHLTDKRLISNVDQIILNARNRGVKAIICNGLDMETNRQVLQLAMNYPEIKPALGIYPLNVLQSYVFEEDKIKIPQFNVKEEIDFIEQQAKEKKIIAIGECGLDGYWVPDSTFPEQEEVFLRFIEIAKNNDLPLIIHTRKLEQRAIEILSASNITKVNFHCFGGKVKLAIKAAENFDWCFSIPANARKNQAFAKMLTELPPDKILTETDAPYLSPHSGELNEPANVHGTVELLAELRNWSIEDAQQIIWDNYQRLFDPEKTWI